MRHLKTRILVWYLATLVVSLIAFVSISITVGTRETRKNVGHLLEMQVEGSIRAYEEGGPQALSKYLQRMDSWFTSTHYLVDARNRDLVSGLVHPASLNLAPQSGQLSTILRRLFRVRRSFAVPSPDGQYRLLYIASQPWDDVPAQLPYYLLVLVGTAVVYWFVPMGIASALKTIATTAERFGGGDLGARVQLPDRKDEIGDLGRTFNAMASHMIAARASRLRRRTGPHRAGSGRCDQPAETGARLPLRPRGESARRDARGGRSPRRQARARSVG